MTAAKFHCLLYLMAMEVYIRYMLGSEISKYLSENLTNWLYSCPDFKARRYGESLKNNFIKIDQFLNSEQGIR